jgi:hypothetical protein
VAIDLTDFSPDLVPPGLPQLFTTPIVSSSAMNPLRSSLLPAVLAFAFAAPLTLAPALQAAPAERTSDGRLSPHQTTSTVIDGCRVTVTYGRPYTRSPKTGEVRQIWGGLVAWDKADRLGADEATLLITQKPLQFGATLIPAGAYTLYQVPSENGPSKLAFSTALGKWGVPVDVSHDLARVDLEKSPLSEPVDQLTIAIEKDKTTGGGVLTIAWEKTKFSAPFTVAK